MKLLSLVLFFSLNFLHAQVVNLADLGENITNLAPKMAILKDCKHDFTYESLQKDEKNYVQNTKEYLYFHFSDVAYCFQFSLDANDADDLWYTLEVKSPWIDRVELYKIQDEELQSLGVSGDHVLKKDRASFHRNIVFHFKVQKGVQKYYLYVQSKDALQLPIYLSRNDIFHKQEIDISLIFGVAFGIFIFMALFNLTNLIMLRDKLYGLYLLYILFFIMMTVSVRGFGLHYLWTDSITLNEIAYNFFMMGYLGFMLLFTREFLLSRIYTPTWDKILLYGGYSYLSFALLTFVIPYPLAMEIGVYSATIIPFIVVVPSVLMLRTDFVLAKFYFAAWLPNTVLYIIWSLSFFGVVADNYFTHYANILGIIIELGIFSLGMAYRFELILKQKNNLEEKIEIDVLCGIKNRYSFDIYSSRIMQEQNEDANSIYFAIMDIDNFKLYNDLYGHPAGDKVLRDISQLLDFELKRQCDEIFRIGGEEFGLFICANNSTHAIKKVEELRECIASKNIEHKKQESGIVTASFGLVLCESSTDVSFEELYKEADLALYRAKENGRNRVEYNSI